MSHYAPHAEAYPIRVNKGDHRRFDSVAGAQPIASRVFCICGAPGEQRCRTCHLKAIERQAALEAENAACEMRQMLAAD